MTQNPQNPAAPVTANGPAPRAMPRWMKPVLALSLTLNLVVLALILGALARGGPMGRMERMAGHGFGAYAQALDRDDRRALFMEMRQQSGDGPAERAAHLAAVASALRAVPFKPEDLKAAMAAQEAAMQGQIGRAHELLLGHLTAMDDAGRLAFAERLLERGASKP